MSAADTRIEHGTPSQIEQINQLLPRLAHFEVPPHRNKEDLWLGDAELFQSWAKGKQPKLTVLVALDENNHVMGVAAASERGDLLTHKPSAHLEVLAVAESAEGRGIGRSLLERIELTMREKGALGMSLHVFGNNHRARSLYTHYGFDEEIIRCFKPFN